MTAFFCGLRQDTYSGKLIKLRIFYNLLFFTHPGHSKMNSYLSAIPQAATIQAQPTVITPPPDKIASLALPAIPATVIAGLALAALGVVFISLPEKDKKLIVASVMEAYNNVRTGLTPKEGLLGDIRRIHSRDTKKIGFVSPKGSIYKGKTADGKLDIWFVKAENTETGGKAKPEIKPDAEKAKPESKPDAEKEYVVVDGKKYEVVRLPPSIPIDSIDDRPASTSNTKVDGKTKRTSTKSN
jgi:hypothetical protein